VFSFLFCHMHASDERTEREFQPPRPRLHKHYRLISCRLDHESEVNVCFLRCCTAIAIIIIIIYVNTQLVTHVVRGLDAGIWMTLCCLIIWVKYIGVWTSFSPMLLINVYVTSYSALIYSRSRDNRCSDVAVRQVHTPTEVALLVRKNIVNDQTACQYGWRRY